MAPDELEQIKQRRRAIKLTAGVSTIFTLASGSALAATSVICDQKDGNVLVIEPPEGGWEFDIGDPTEDGYIYDGDNRFVTASCWTSISVSQAAGAANSRIP